MSLSLLEGKSEKQIKKISEKISDFKKMDLYLSRVMRESGGWYSMFIEGFLDKKNYSDLKFKISNLQVLKDLTHNLKEAMVKAGFRCDISREERYEEHKDYGKLFFIDYHLSVLGRV